MMAITITILICITVIYISILVIGYFNAKTFQTHLENIDSVISIIYENMYTNKIRNNIAIDNVLNKEEENKLVNECIKKYRMIVSRDSTKYSEKILAGEIGLNNYISVRFLSLYNKSLNMKHEKRTTKLKG